MSEPKRVRTKTRRRVEENARNPQLTIRYTVQVVVSIYDARGKPYEYPLLFVKLGIPLDCV